MAGVLHALETYVTKMLADMAKDEVAMMIGVTGNIDDLSVKLSDLKNFIADADRRTITDESVQGWVEELKHAMYHAADILDLCHLKFMEQGPSKDMGCLNPLLFCMRNPLHAHDIGSRIKALNKKLDSICMRGRSFNFIKLEAYQDQKTTHPPPFSRKTDPLLERSGVVGEKIEEETRALVDMLTKEVVEESHNVMVVAIVGVGGIGKTTLSKKVFNDQVIQDKFAKKIWLSITQEFNEVDLLRTAIIAVDGNLPGPGGGSQDRALLVPALASAIGDKKLFLVLDDMWDINEWTNLLRAPISHGAPGSRVLVTTRHETVARGMKAVHPYHHVQKLGHEDGWSLLMKQILPTDKIEPAIDMLKDIGLQIIEKCDGLPLAIKVMGGLLCQKERERRAWEKVLNDAIWSVCQMPEELNYAIYLSYEDLSPCLKQCFLHFSLKPKNIELHDSENVSMWIGEGYVHGDSDLLEDLGTEYHTELILRNLIEPDTSYPGQYVCNMHDVVRSFAQFVSKNEALVVHNGEIIKSSKLGLQRFLRLSIETKGLESNELEWSSLKEQTSLRTIIFVGNFKIQPRNSLITFSSLRTLHIVSSSFSAVVESLHHLKHLRYLAVKECINITRLPKNIHKMKFLQHISLEGCKNFFEVPNSIVKLLELRFLDLDRTCVTTMPRGFRALIRLRTLHGFPAHMDGDWCSLEELGALTQLRSISIVALQNVSAASFATKARLGEKVYLSMLRLYCNSRLGDDGLMKETISKKNQKLIEEVFDGLSPPPCIEYIRIYGYYGCQLPKWMKSTTITHFHSLRTLKMNDLACCTQLPDGLCQLPCLEYLLVSRAPAIKQIGPEFMQPYDHGHHSSSQVVCAFPKLLEMEFIGMVELEVWEWEVVMHGMIVLEKLLIKDCKLRCIPPGLSTHARALKRLTLHRVKHLQSLHNFSSVVELNLHDLPDLTSISNFPKLQKLQIHLCWRLESLKEITTLRRLELTIYYFEKRLPEYLQTIRSNHLLLDCCPKLLAYMAAGKSGPEWHKFSHIQQVEAYADDGGNAKKWHLFYTREPYNMETNIEPSLEELSEHEDAEILLSRLARLALLLRSLNEDEEDVDNQDEEDLEELPEHEDAETLLSRSSDEDEEDLDNQDEENLGELSEHEDEDDLENQGNQDEEDPEEVSSPEGVEALLFHLYVLSRLLDEHEENVENPDNTEEE